jgi:hypothetical protein
VPADKGMSAWQLFYAIRFTSRMHELEWLLPAGRLTGIGLLRSFDVEHVRSVADLAPVPVAPLLTALAFAPDK